jgi:hypothetical protein
VEDEWKVTPKLTINAGLRYNVFNALSALNRRGIPFDFATCGGFCPDTYSYFHPRYNDIDPRIGIAWSHGNTVVRIGAGIYHTDGHTDGQAHDQNLPISNTVSRYSFNNVLFPGLSYPLDPFLAYAENGGLGVFSPRDLEERHRVGCRLRRTPSSGVSRRRVSVSTRRGHQGHSPGIETFPGQTEDGLFL